MPPAHEAKHQGLGSLDDTIELIFGRDPFCQVAVVGYDVAYDDSVQEMAISSSLIVSSEGFKIVTEESD